MNLIKSIINKIKGNSKMPSSINKNSSILLSAKMINNVSNFEKSILDFFDTLFAVPMVVDGWGECSFLSKDSDEIKKLFSLSVKSHYRFYILSNGTVVFATPLSTVHSWKDKEFIENYERNFNASPHGDLSFSFMDLGDGLAYPFICYYAKNMFMGYNVACQTENKGELSLNEMYYMIIKQLIEYIEGVKSKIIKPYH